MNRALTLLAASACAALAVTSACFAADWNSLPFRLAKTGHAGQVQLSIEHRSENKRSGNWSQSIALVNLQGLDARHLVSRSSLPIRFSLNRPAGRFECSGSVRSYDGRGTCAFAADAAYAAMLEKRGIGRPTRGQSYQLALADFRPEVLDALASAGYPRPTIDQSVALGIFAIDPAYVRGLADAGHRLGKIDDLVGFKIHRVTPELIRAYSSLGMERLAADDLMAMAIHRVTPDYIRGFASLGYRDLPADKLVQMRIFNVTPEDVRALQASGKGLPSADQLIRLRLAGFGPKRRGR